MARTHLRWQPSPFALAAPGTPAVQASLFGGVFPAPGGGGTQDLTGSGDSVEYVMGNGFLLGVPGTVPAIRWFVPTVAQPTNGDFAIGLFLADPTGGILSPTSLLTSQSVTAPTAGAAGTWVDFTLAAPQTRSAGDIVYPVVRTNRYAYSTNVFTSAVVNGPLTGVANNPPNFPNGSYDSANATNNPLTNPTQGGGTSYGIDILFQAS